MSDLSYTVVPTKLKQFLEKIPDTGVPAKLTSQELVARGFKSSNDRSIVPVLKAIGMVDGSSVPTSNWAAYRDRKNNRRLMGQLIRSAYGSLYDVYPDAHVRSDEDLRNLMATKTRSGERVVTAMLGTFRALSSMADFEEQETAREETNTERLERKESEGAIDEGSISIELRSPRARLIVPADLSSKEKARITTWFAKVVEPWLDMHVNELDGEADA
jgi:hypothetical protein